MEGDLMDEERLQVLLVAASEMEVGEAITVSRSEETKGLCNALIALYPDRTFFLKPLLETANDMQLSRVMYEDVF